MHCGVFLNKCSDGVTVYFQLKRDATTRDVGTAVSIHNKKLFSDVCQVL